MKCGLEQMYFYKKKKNGFAGQGKLQAVGYVVGYVVAVIRLAIWRTVALLVIRNLNLETLVRTICLTASAIRFFNPF